MNLSDKDLERILSALEECTPDEFRIGLRQRISAEIRRRNNQSE